MYHNQLFAACWVQRKSDTKSLRCLSRPRNPSRVDSDCIGFDRQLCVKLILLFVAALPHHGSKRVGRSLIDEDMAAALPSSLGGSSFSPSASAGVRPKSSQRKKECTPLPWWLCVNPAERINAKNWALSAIRRFHAWIDIHRCPDVSKTFRKIQSGTEDH